MSLDTLKKPIASFRNHDGLLYTTLFSAPANRRIKLNRVLGSRLVIRPAHDTSFESRIGKPKQRQGHKGNQGGSSRSITETSARLFRVKQTGENETDVTQLEWKKDTALEDQRESERVNPSSTAQNRTSVKETEPRQCELNHIIAEANEVDVN